MNHKSRAQQLAELSYLWTTGEWTLHCSNHSRARVIFVFPDGQSSPHELLAVRALVPRFADSPISLLKREVGPLPEFVVGEFGSIEAHRLQSAAQARGLQTRMEDASTTCYVPVSIHGSALLIEDHELASLAAEEMRRRGVPIVPEEID